MKKNATLALMESCNALALCVIESLEKERQCVIEFNMEAFKQNIIKQESLVDALMLKRQMLETHLNNDLGYKKGASMSEHLDGPEFNTYQQLESQWSQLWEEMIERVKYNADLIVYSERNLGVLSNHLRKLLIETKQYNAQGRAQERGSDAKVVEARY